MAPSLKDVVTELNRSGALIDSVLEQERDPESRASLLAARTRLATARGMIEHLEKEPAAHRQASVEEEWLANVNELVGPILHEVNNFLNTVLLHVAVLEAEVAETHAPDLAEIRRQGGVLAALVGRFQQCRQRQRPAPEPVDLNGIISEVVAALGSGLSGPGQALPAHTPVRWLPAPELPPVQGSAGDLKRLFTFLLKNAVAASPETEPVTIRTEKEKGRVVSVIEDRGPPAAADLLANFFDPGVVGREGTNSLELAACKALVRRLQGKLHCENRAGGGVTITVELPAASA
jgi:signal transduction histidine kinase